MSATKPKSITIVLTPSEFEEVANLIGAAQAVTQSCIGKAGFSQAGIQERAAFLKRLWVKTGDAYRAAEATNE